MGGVIERWIDDWQIGLLHGSQRAPSHATLVVTLVACFRRVAVGSLRAFDVGSGLADPVAGVADTSAGSMASPVPTVWSKTVSPRVVRRWSRTPGRSIDRLGDRAASLSGPVDGRGSVGLVGAVEEHGPVGQCGGQVGLVTAGVGRTREWSRAGPVLGRVTEDRFEVGRFPGDHRLGWNPITRGSSKASGIQYLTRSVMRRCAVPAIIAVVGGVAPFGRGVGVGASVVGVERGC